VVEVNAVLWAVFRSDLEVLRVQFRVGVSSSSTSVYSLPSHTPFQDAPEYWASNCTGASDPLSPPRVAQ